ncbi:MAG: ROK family protein [Paracoccaceae bacterium]
MKSNNEGFDKPMNTPATKSVSEQREIGRQQVLDTIRAKQQIARIDIAAVTGFSPATVTTITAELLAGGLIQESATDTRDPGAKRGRPRVTLQLRGAAHYIAGVKVTQSSVTVLIVDFEGVEVLLSETPLPAARCTPWDLVNAIKMSLETACTKAGLVLSDLSGAGVGLAGFIDADACFVHWSSSLSERNVDLGPELARQLPFPVFIDNDANLVAKAEHLFGEGRNHSNFLVVTIEHGVGLGIVIDGKIFRGTRGCGAEFGHMKVQMDGALCQCGQRGCLEAYVGEYALMNAASLSHAEALFDDIASLSAAAAQNDPFAHMVLDQAQRMLSLGLANLINLFDPQLIILAGNDHMVRVPYIDAAIEQASRLIVQVDAPMPPIRVHSWDNSLWAKGAAAYGIEKVSALSVRDLVRNGS